MKLTGDVTKVESYAFSCRGEIIKLTLGSQLTDIGERAFANFNGLKEIRVVDKTPLTTIGAGLFEKVDKTECTLYVRAGSVAKFKAASQWGEFTNIKEYGTTVKAHNTTRKYGEENPRMGYAINGDFVAHQSSPATPHRPRPWANIQSTWRQVR